MKPDFDIYILAGGKSSRMKTEKGLVMLKGKPMIEWVIQACEPFQTNITIIANSTHYSYLPYPTIKDDITNCGPIGGIVTALHHSEKQNVLVLSCDIPYIQTAVLKALLNSSDPFADAHIPIHKNIIHPLIGIYKKSATETILKQIESANYKLLHLLKKLNTAYINMDKFGDSNFENINHPEDLKKS